MPCHSATDAVGTSTTRPKRTRLAQRAECASTSAFILPPWSATPCTSTLPVASSSRPRSPTRGFTSHEFTPDGELDRDSHNKPANKNRKTGNPPRPPNAWICYRSARVRELRDTEQYSKMPQASISKLIGELWRSESSEVKKRYEDEATAKKLEHKEKYPDYLFRPVRREQLKKPKKGDSDGSKRPSRLDEMPSVLLPAPKTTPTGLPSPLPTFEPVESRQSFPLEQDYPYPPTPTSLPPPSSYSRAEHDMTEFESPEPPVLSPIDTSHVWTMFQPVTDCLPTPPVESYAPGPSPPYYPSYISPECVSPTYQMSASSPSSTSFDQNLSDQYLLYSSMYISPVSTEGVSLATQHWGPPNGSHDDYYDAYPPHDPSYPTSHS